MGHINIPIFIPHLGCPNQCIFCNQRHISGQIEFDENDVRNQINSVLSTVVNCDDVEIAFFGGSFTGIDRALMIRLLDVAQEYVKLGKALGIRMSTRPDYISEEILDVLSNYTISCVELGIQSMNDSVLKYLKRGHTTEDTKTAVHMLKNRGFRFVGQMMIGLPTATLEDELDCAEFICASGAVGARIYPTLVFKQTELEVLALSGKYTPLTLEEAVERSAKVLGVFAKENVPCIRIGLCESENLHSDQTFVAGPNHPSIGEMIKSELYLSIVIKALDGKKHSNSVIVFCPRGATSQVIGNKRKNLKKLKEIFGFKEIKIVEDLDLTPFNIIIKDKED
jgi:histone acetyltransferase (RNA polymerase elongator complex component)